MLSLNHRDNADVEEEVCDYESA
jgi:hypothetical protein